MPALESSLLFVAFGCLLSLLLIRAPLDAWSPATAPASPPCPHPPHNHAYPPTAPPPPPAAPGGMAPYQPPYPYPPGGPHAPAAHVQSHPGASVSSFLVLLIATAIMGWLSWTTVWPEAAADAGGTTGAAAAADGADAAIKADTAGSKDDEKKPEEAPAAKDDESEVEAAASPTISSAAASAGSMSSPTSSRHSSGKSKHSQSSARPSSPPPRPSSPEPEPAPEEPHTRIEALAAALPLPEVVRNVVEALSKPLKEDKPAAESSSALGDKQDGGHEKTSSPAPEEVVSEPPTAMPERSSSAVAELAAQRGLTTRPPADLLERATQELVAKHPELARAGAADVRGEPRSD
ncbi:hypothetical protein FA09DRAFT_359721 [Tilletiopsis washingtonensis]|uniref:Uncharacterized protein n=1 Tax=Tilletiopsis washingtonensis TaxID=58919 RepID=A0A316ZDK1_9BASI|nr:hypothetical protein FA09DRAFT_359721 [Tilletiopsis washingtonensis]PWN99114.1 hypothetical protein FA09DRAFT_359721 [Tilletiopsis washingtonensis]